MSFGGSVDGMIASLKANKRSKWPKANSNGAAIQKKM